MFARAHRGLFDFTAAALCLWAAAYHTPAGALVRSVVARITSSADTTKPLLAYYSGGVYDAHEVQVPPPGPLSQLPSAENIPPGSALGRGVYATVLRLGPTANATAMAVAQRYHLPGVATPDDAAALVARLKTDLQTDDAAVLSLFTGYDIALYATQRAKAEGRPLSLEALVLQLPPSSAGALAAASASLSLGTAYALGWPVLAKTPVTSPFGWRTHPITGAQQLHSGVDLAVPEGTQVTVVADGVVRRASEDDLNGRMIIVDHGHGVATAYCHNSVLLVSVGAVVKAGDVISQSGTTGRSTGPHLHYQLNLASKPTDPFVFREKRTLPEMPAPVPSPSGSSTLKSAFDRVGVKPDVGGTDN